MNAATLPKRPNILLLLARAAETTSKETPATASPFRDALVKQGITFTHAFASTPSPDADVHALLTGLHPDRFDAAPGPSSTQEPHRKTRSTQPTLADYLGKAGYDLATIDLEPGASHQALSPILRFLDRRHSQPFLAQINWRGPPPSNEDLGALVTPLRRNGSEDDTLILFLGNATAEPGTATLRVPLIIQWKSGLPGDVIESRPVSILDILPTCLAAARATLPTTATCDGVNLLPFLRKQLTKAPYGDLTGTQQNELSRRTSWERWEKDILAFENSDRTNPPPTQATLFLGSSTIRLWNSLASDFPECRVINRGFGGSEIPDSVDYLDRIVIPFKPRTIVVYAGDNDLANGRWPEQVCADFKELAARIRTQLPHTRVLFLAIKPSPSRRALMEDGRRTNQLIAEHCRRTRGLEYVDVFNPTLGPDGEPRPELFEEDKLHLNAAGYAVWTEVLRKHLFPTER